MIEVTGFRKTYGGFDAVVGSDFAVEEGEVFGIVGPNGAGKTTTLKTLAGLIEPTDGEVRVAGYDAGDPEMRRRLGFLPEESPLYEDMTPLSYLRFFADLYDVPRSVANDRIDDALDRLELAHRTRRLGDMSKGMKRKVAIARSLVNDPDVLIYDEPASGLDPVTTNSVLAFTHELRAAGKTVVFSAHDLHHVESVCDRVIVMNEGEIIARGSVEELRETYGTVEYVVTTTVAPELDDVETTAVAPTGATDAADVTTPSTADGTAPTAAEAAARYRTVVTSMTDVERIRRATVDAGGEVTDVRTDEPTLESVFLSIVGEPMAGAAARGEHVSRHTDEAGDA
ncbi:ABC transporter ATP-binding protein [haloarchaeon 3A1-DGR]|nr:ABC transporter ATP-binding protein [haloarchaeon 3A1-DGR]